MNSRLHSGLLTGAAIVAALVFVPATAASAHDELIASSPAQNENLQTAPSEITLEYSDELMTIGAVVLVMDADEQDWAAGEAQLSGTTVTIPLTAGMPEAGYEVRWRVVSNDGHPISGVVPFTIGDAEPLTRENDAQAEPGAQDEAAAADSDAADAESQTPAAAPFPWRVLLIGAGGAAIAAGLFALFTFIGRRRARRGQNASAE